MQYYKPPLFVHHKNINRLLYKSFVSSPTFTWNRRSTSFSISSKGHLPPCFTSSSSSPPWCPRATSPTLCPPPPTPRLSAPASLPCHFQSWCCTVGCSSPTEVWWLNVLILYLILTLLELVECRQKVDLYLWHVFRNLLFVFVFDHLCRIGKWYKVEGMEK